MRPEERIAFYKEVPSPAYPKAEPHFTRALLFLAVAHLDTLISPDPSFYSLQIPPWMRHCPFAYVMQKNAAMQVRFWPAWKCCI